MTLSASKSGQRPLQEISNDVYSSGWRLSNYSCSHRRCRTTRISTIYVKVEFCLSPTSRQHILAFVPCHPSRTCNVPDLEKICNVLSLSVRGSHTLNMLGRPYDFLHGSSVSPIKLALQEQVPLETCRMHSKRYSEPPALIPFI